MAELGATEDAGEESDGDEVAWTPEPMEAMTSEDDAAAGGAPSEGAKDDPLDTVRQPLGQDVVAEPEVASAEVPEVSQEPDVPQEQPRDPIDVGLLYDELTRASIAVDALEEEEASLRQEIAALKEARRRDDPDAAKAPRVSRRWSVAFGAGRQAVDDRSVSELVEVRSAAEEEMTKLGLPVRSAGFQSVGTESAAQEKFLRPRVSREGSEGTGSRIELAKLGLAVPGDGAAAPQRFTDRYRDLISARGRDAEPSDDRLVELRGALDRLTGEERKRARTNAALRREAEHLAETARKGGAGPSATSDILSFTRPAGS